MPPRKPRCTFKECKDAAQRIVGDCGFCDGHYCAKHRLLEDHKCSGLEDVSSKATTKPKADASPKSSTPSLGWWLVGLGEVLQEFIDDEDLVPSQ